MGGLLHEVLLGVRGLASNKFGVGSGHLKKTWPRLQSRSTVDYEPQTLDFVAKRAALAAHHTDCGEEPAVLFSASQPLR
eukprot:3906236-Amphidinium_carterae.1